MAHCPKDIGTVLVPQEALQTPEKQEAGLIPDTGMVSAVPGDPFCSFWDICFASWNSRLIVKKHYKKELLKESGYSVESTNPFR